MLMAVDNETFKSEALRIYKYWILLQGFTVGACKGSARVIGGVVDVSGLVSGPPGSHGSHMAASLCLVFVTTVV